MVQEGVKEKIALERRGRVENKGGRAKEMDGWTEGVAGERGYTWKVERENGNEMERLQGSIENLLVMWVEKYMGPKVLDPGFQNIT